jgi:hypothetical protein
MRPRFLLLVTAGLFLAFAGSAFGQDEARAVLDRAIKAHGGVEKINKMRATRAKTKGRIEIMDGVDFVQELVAQAPNKYREEIDLEVNGEKLKITSIFNGTKGAVEVNGKPVPLDDKIQEALRQGAEIMEISRLVTLRAKPYELSALGEAKVNDRPAVGIRVSRKGARDVNIYFDKGTGLLAKMEYRTVDQLSKKEVTEERIVRDYMKVDGLPTPKRVVVNHDGQRFLEAEVQEVQRLESIDDSEFKLP